MKQLFILLTISLLPFHLFAQNSLNMVPNGDFESYQSLPSEPGDWQAVENWHNVSHQPHASDLFGSPDYYHLNANSSYQAPNTPFGLVPPHSGNAMMGFYSILDGQAEVREYISIELTQALLIGKPYELSFVLTNGANNRFGKGTNGIGALLSEQAANQPEGRFRITEEAQLMIEDVVYDENWQVIRLNFTPTKAYQHLTIGNFLSDAQTEIQSLQAGTSADQSAYYFIDDVKIFPLFPVIQVQQNELSICQGEEVVLRASGDVKYAWVNAEAPYDTLGKASSLRVSPTQNTTYRVYGHETYADVQVVVEKAIPVNLGRDTTICESDVLELSAENYDGNYQWQDLSTEPTFLVNSPGLYSLSVQNSCGTFNDEIRVNFTPIAECLRLLVPSAFSPNNDGINDFFGIANDGLATLELKVYDRWGRLVFEGNDTRAVWDGVSQGKAAAEGVYVWKAQYSFPNGATGKQAGSLTLIR